MAHHHEPEENLSHEEIMYRYYITRGSDFTKIDLFLSAKNHYALALNFKPGDSFALKRIEECTAQIKSDRVKVLVVLPFLFALIAAVVIANM